MLLGVLPGGMRLRTCLRYPLSVCSVLLPTLNLSFLICEWGPLRCLPHNYHTKGLRAHRQSLASVMTCVLPTTACPA